MHTLISERVKLDMGLSPRALNNTNATGPYYHMRDYSRALAALEVSTMAATKTAKVEFLQATDAAGTDAKAVTGSDATATANAYATEATVTLTNFGNGKKITVNGLVYTAHTDTTTEANREFKIDGDDTADAAALAGLINDAVYGVPGVTASAALGVVTLTSTSPGETAITVSSDDAAGVVATTKMLVYSEISESDLDAANGFEWVAAKATVTSNSVVSATLVRADCQGAIDQAAGASAT